MFEGFSPETFDFLWGIRLNNNRDWFAQHKQQYASTLYEPMKALSKELFQPFMDQPGNLLKVSRIYRDARLHHPDPYKESLWICIRQNVEWWAENPCMYFDIHPEGASFGFCFWRPRVSTMEEFRQTITAQPEEFLSMLADVETATGQCVTAQLYKRPKVTEDERLQPYFAWKADISCTRSLEPCEALFSPQLSLQVQDYFQKLLPLYQYFTRFRV